MKFRKRPIVIEAIQWDGDLQKVSHFFGDFKKWHLSQIKEVGSVFIETLEGVHEARINDWIIKGIKVEFYPCKPYIFEETYEEAD